MLTEDQKKQLRQLMASMPGAMPFNSQAYKANPIGFYTEGAFAFEVANTNFLDGPSASPVNLLSNGILVDPTLSKRGFRGANPLLGLALMTFSLRLTRIVGLDVNDVSEIDSFPPDIVQSILSGLYVKHRPQGAEVDRFIALRPFHRPDAPFLTPAIAMTNGEAPTTVGAYSFGVQLYPTRYRPDVNGAVPVNCQVDTLEAGFASNLSNPVVNSYYPQSSGTYPAFKIGVILEYRALGFANPNANWDTIQAYCDCGPNGVRDGMFGPDNEATLARYAEAVAVEGSES